MNLSVSLKIGKSDNLGLSIGRNDYSNLIDVRDKSDSRVLKDRFFSVLRSHSEDGEEDAVLSNDFIGWFSDWFFWNRW